MTCPSCGTPTVPSARFCFACGSPLPDRTGSDSASERRFVTVLFGDLSDFTSWSEDLDPERVGVVTDRVLATLAEVVHDFGGHVDKLTGDGLMAVFGAPTTHEDDAERAVRAAARMQTAVRRVVEQESGGGRRLGLRVGLNTGEVIAGIQAHLSYTVIGDTVNTAARLSDAAGVGGVYAGRDTALATMSVASWRALTPLRLKGKREPVPAYELMALRPASASRLGFGDEAPMVGREAEFGVLLGRMLEVADTGRPRAVLLTGDAGLGKTRLAQELTRFSGELPDTRILWGRCTPYGEGRDLGAVVDMVRTACGIDESDDVETARERVDRTLERLEHPDRRGRIPRQTAEALRRLLGLDPEQIVGPREAATPGTPTGGDQVRAAVAVLFSALAQQGPLLLVLDDVQWATPLMLDGLRDVAGATRGPVLLVAAGRPDMLEARALGADAPQWWRELPAVEVLPLLPLEDSALERLLRAYLGTPTGELAPEVRAALLARAEGNPFFLAELLQLLVDRGTLVRDGDAWVLVGEVPEGVLPAGVQAVLAARIDDLAGPVKGVLRDAAVLGDRLTGAGLAAVGQASGHGDPVVVRDALGTLIERRLLEVTPGSDDGYRFGHALVRDVAYAGLAKSERARRHAAAAAYLLAPEAGLGRSAEADALVASQGERALRLAAEMSLSAGDPAWHARALAVPALARLGAEALGRDENLQAESLFARALALLEGAGDAALGDAVDEDRIRIGRARALAQLHRLDEALATVRPLLEVGLEPPLRAQALLVLGDVHRKNGRTAAARDSFVQALSLAGDAGIDRLAGEALRQLGLLDYFDGRLRDAEQRFRQAYDLAERVQDQHGAGWALQQLAWSATTRGDYALADRTLEQAAEVFSDLEDTGGLTWVAGSEGFVRLLQGRLREARDLAQTLLPLGEQSGERWGVAALLTIDALAASELGDVEAAMTTAVSAREKFVELGDVWGQALALVAEAAGARGAGQHDRALELLREAVTLSEAAAYPLLGGLALVVTGYCHLEQDDVEQAEVAAYRASAVLSGFDLEPHARLGADVLLAQVLRARGQYDVALAHMDAALAVPSETALLFPRRQALAHRAGILLQLGRVEEAVAAGHEAAESPAEDVRACVLGLRALGSALRADGDASADRVLTEALALARSTGQRSEVAASERALAGAS